MGRFGISLDARRRQGRADRSAHAVRLFGCFPLKRGVDVPARLHPASRFESLIGAGTSIRALARGGFRPMLRRHWRDATDGGEVHLGRLFPLSFYAVSLSGTRLDLSFVLWFASIRPLGFLPRFGSRENASSTEEVMAPARKRRRLPTLIDRGLGLLEVILPLGGVDEPVSTLPHGQRDPGGFWFPAGYTQPGDIFTVAQRRLQAKQRQVQRYRHKSRGAPPPIVSGSEETAAAGRPPSRPHSLPGARPGAPAEKTVAISSGPVAAGLADRPLPLPALSREAPETDVPVDRIRSGHRAPPAALGVRPSLPDPERARAVAARPVVDSHKGSD